RTNVTIWRVDMSSSGCLAWVGRVGETGWTRIGAPMRYDDEDELGRAANQRWATFPDPGSEEEREAFRYESRQRIREMYARVRNDPERAYRHEELRAKLDALESEWHAKDVAAGRVPESALPPLRTTDDPPTSDVEERAPRRQTRDEVWAR